MADYIKKFFGLQPGKDIDFMGSRKYFLSASVILVIASAVLFFAPGPRFGTDFSGGTEVEAAFAESVEPGDVRTAVEELGFHSPEVVGVANPEGKNQYIIRVQEVSTLTPEQVAEIERALCLVPEEGGAPPGDCPEALWTTEVKVSPGGDKISARYQQEVCGPAEGEVSCPPRADIKEQLQGKVEGVELRTTGANPIVQNPRDNKVEFFLKSKGDLILDGLAAKMGAESVKPLRVEWVGPKAGQQLRDAAIKSIVIALVFIMGYIAFRFDIRFAPGAIAALAHDVLLAMGALILTGREITLATVAALLTIVGYSINDTVVVYDRIRENLGKHRNMSFTKLVNRSVTQMLGRTIKTQATTAIALVPFLVWGTGVIKNFAFTLVIGIVVGTYSSIYLAAPLTELVDRRLFTDANKKTKKKRRVRRRKKEGAGDRARVTA